MKDEISAALLSARKASGLTQKELAAKSGVDEAAISHYENARREPTIKNLHAIADALGVSLDSLTGGKHVTTAKIDSAKRHLVVAAENLPSGGASLSEVAAARRSVKKASKDLGGCK